MEYPQYDGMDLKTAAKCLAYLKDLHADQKRSAANTWAEHEYLTKHWFPELMESMGLTTVNIKGVGRLELRHDASVSVPKENKHLVYEWLEDNGYGDLIVGTVNSSTMKAQVKKWIKDGEDFPIDLINFNPYDNAVLIKAK